MTQEITIPSALQNIDYFRKTMMELGEDSPEKAYLIGNQIAKLGKELQDQFKEWFRWYFDKYKEVPGGFEVKVSMRKSYKFEENLDWRNKKEELDFIESQLKNATDQSEKWNMVFNNSWEQIEPVSVSFSEVYSVKKI